MKNFLKYLFLVGLFISVQSFITIEKPTVENTKDNIEQPQVNEQSDGNPKATLAKELSCLFSRNSGVKVFLFRKCLETRVGDQEAFWNVIKDQRAINGQSLSSLLIAQNPANQLLLNQICRQFPATTILLVGNQNNNASPNISNKVYCDLGFDERNPNARIDFFENCKHGSTSIRQAPKVLTLVVRESERHVTQQDLASKYPNLVNPIVSMGKACGKDILVFGPGPNTGGPNGPTGGGGGGGSSSCERDHVNGTENLRRFRARNDYDGAFRGDGEFVIHSIFTNDVQYTTASNGEIVITGGALDYVTHIYLGVKDDNKYVYPDFSIKRWDKDKDGDNMKHIWVETDGGGPITTNFTLGFTFKGATASLPIPITWGSKDDFIGEDIVNYCEDIDSNGYKYSPSNKVDFHMSER